MNQESKNNILEEVIEQSNENSVNETIKQEGESVEAGSTEKKEDMCDNNGAGEEINKEENSLDINELVLKLEQKTKEVEEYIELLQRTLAEFDNYKKRTAKEKEMLYKEAVLDIISSILPIIDNLEKAVEVSNTQEQSKIIEGVEMTLRQFKEVLNQYNISEIDALGKKFDPKFHEAIMHIEDENYGESEIIEVFRKGYICGDRVIRHSMVKVAN